LESPTASALRWCAAALRIAVFPETRGNAGQRNAYSRK
jgi:hypothetical protein